MDPILIPVLGIVFVFGIPIVAIITEHFTKKRKMQVIEKAIEKGLPLDGLSLDDKGPRLPYRAGMVLLALGLGGGIFAVLLGQVAEKALYPCLGVASILVLIGVALIINDKINYDRFFNEESDPQ